MAWRSRLRWGGNRLGALAITVAYALVGAFWVFISDRLLERSLYGRAGMGWAQTAKGWLYVLVTAAVLYPLARGWERHLRRSEERYRALFDGGSDAVLVYDESVDGESPALVEVNGVACEWLGYSRDELLARALGDVIVGPQRPWDPGGASDEADAFARLYEAELLARDGRHIPVEVSARRVRVDGRRTVLAVARDIGERRCAGQALRVRDAALNASIAGMVSIDLNGIVTYANPSFARMWGYRDSEQIVGTRVDSFMVLPQEAATISSALWEVGRWAGQARAKRRDGTPFDVQVWASLVHGDDGEPISAAAWAIDITERLAAERALRDSEEKYRLLVENANEVILVAQDGWLRYMNRRAEEVFRLTLEELTAHPFADRIHPDDRAMVMERHRARLRGEGYPRPYAFRILDGRNEVRWVEVSGVTMAWEGKPASLNFISDITERKMAEDALRESEERYRLLVENQGEGIAMADPDDSFTFANRAAEEIFGVGPSGLIGKNISEFVTPEQLATIQEQTALRRRGHKSTYEIAITRPDGQERTLLLTAAPQTDREGRFVGTFGIFRDVTERKHAEEERERLIGELQEALSQVKTLRGLLPICANCKKVRDDGGYWHMVETYVRDHSDAEFTHTLCPECMAKLYPQYADSEEQEGRR